MSPKVNEQFWNSLSKPQRERLKRYECGLCDQRLDRTLRHSCAAIWGPKCSKKTNRDRAIRCLDASKLTHIRFNEDVA